MGRRRLSQQLHNHMRTPATKESAPPSSSGAAGQPSSRPVKPRRPQRKARTHDHVAQSEALLIVGDIGAEVRVPAHPGMQVDLESRLQVPAAGTLGTGFPFLGAAAAVGLGPLGGFGTMMQMSAACFAEPLRECINSDHRPERLISRRLDSVHRYGG